MKIGIDISPVIFPQFGAGVYTRQLVSRLVADYPDDDFFLFGSSLRAKPKLLEFMASLETKPGRVTTKLYPLPITFWEIVWNRWHCLAVEKLIGPVDLFHASDWVQPPTQAKCLTTVHDLAFRFWPRTFHPRILGNQKRRLAWAKKECFLVLADSQATKNDLVAVLGFDPNRVRVVYLGVDHGQYHAGISEAKISRVKEKYQITKPYFLSVGTRNPRKNLPRVLEAFAQVKKSRAGRDFALVLIGRFGWGEEVRPQADLILTGFVPDDDLAPLYAGARLLVFPSLYEGFGLPVLEAMACGTPVVTSQTSSLPEVGGEAAVYVDPEKTEEIAAAISEQLALSQDELGRQRQKLLAQARKFSWEQCARETYAVYQEILES